MDGRTDRRTDGRTDNVKTVYPPTNTVCGGYNNATFALYINTAFVVNIIPDIKHDALMSCNGNASHFIFMNTRQSVLHLRMKIYLGRLRVAENINAPMIYIGRRKG